MSISTTRGDGGQTGLAGGIRVSKADLRVESYGTVDELNTVLGFARSICQNREIKAWTETIQRTLFRLGSALATPPESKKEPPVISAEDVAMLTELVHKIEAIEGILSDWSLPGAHTESAAYEVARTVFPASKARVANDERPPESISDETTAAPTRGERTPVASIISEGIKER